MSMVIDRVRQRQHFALVNIHARLSKELAEARKHGGFDEDGNPPMTWKDWLGVAAFFGFIILSIAGWGMFIRYTFFK